MTADETADTAAAPQLPAFSVLAQYVKDLSLENPNAPQIFQAPAGKPGVDLSVNVTANRIADNTYEVLLNLHIKATSDDKALFLIELDYGGVFGIRGVPENRMEPVLLVDCPMMLFPFARRIVADASRDAGFHPLLLDPVDFRSIYLKNRTGRQETAADGDEAAA